MDGRLKAVLLLIIMFGLGLFTGRAWERYDMARMPRFAPSQSSRLHRFYQDLNLTPDQEKQMNAIFAKAHERATQINEEVAWDLTEVHDDSLNAIEAVLTPEQRTRFAVIRHHWLQHAGHKRHLEPVAAPTGQ